MDERYSAFCFADRHFYDSPVRTRGDDVDFATALQPVPEGWDRSESGDWLIYHPTDGNLPPQGWKIHASATLDDAERILDIAWAYCMQRRIAFKFIRSLQLLFLRNIKYADRSASGKFITIYPRDERELETVCTELGDLLAGMQGPYILSDLRWGDGPLYVRWGGFADRYCVGPNGSLVLAVEDGEGALVPDRRGPTFVVPSWVTLPACVEPHLAARNAVTVQELPFRIERALQFSNGGGLYAGTEIATDERVVLKEARPHAGLAYDRADAVARLDRERRTLEQLAGLDCVPRIHGHFVIGDHRFLALDYIDGEPLRAVLVEHYPVIVTEVDAETARTYTEWALDAYRRVEHAVDAVHERGVVIGDLHPSNILMRPDGRPALIDFEVAAELAEGRHPTLADPAFMAPGDRQGLDIDRYALACLKLFMFMPLTRLLVIDRGKARELADEIAATYPVPREFLDEAVSTIVGSGATPARASSTNGSMPKAANRVRITAQPDSWLRARDSMAAAILNSATLHRDDRLFPGDIQQFDTPAGGINMAHGAAGVLYALAASGAARQPDHEEWLVRHPLRPERGTPIGFYDGLHGVAHVLHRLGHRREARQILDICTTELDGRDDRIGTDLLSGLAGIGLNYAWFAHATGDSELLKTAWRIAAIIADRLGGEDDVAEVSGGSEPYAGLTRGSSGPALLFLRLYQRRADPALLDLAAIALRQDLRRCVQSDDCLEVNEGWRLMPYLADGSVGIGFALDEYLAQRDDERFASASAAVRRVAQAHFFIEPGLFYGRAGMILYLAQRAQRYASEGKQLEASVAAHVRHLNWHALDYEGELAFPGDQLLRLSMDLTTGSAGVLLALAAAMHELPATLPFLEGPGPGPERQELTTHTRKEVNELGDSRLAGSGGEA